ncbi:anthranilate synthase component I family protein [Pseudocnuella soli]|uniref:anthranilate synthase component I family protein n=1 Tax=Pseudocnuella soli TaxID=2502779 RepID=UPI001053A185|nr:anthranilate synthase component I family protein [Pseudocnuella soli]
MKKILIETTAKKILADLYTPVGIYLRLRDRFRDTILLESTDHHVAENSFSFICINAIGGIEVQSSDKAEFKLPGAEPQKVALAGQKIEDVLYNFLQRFEGTSNDPKVAQFAQGLYGYCSFDAVQLFETVSFKKDGGNETAIPLARYRLYQYVIAINHFKDELWLIENGVAGVESELPLVESLIRSRDLPVYPFRAVASETSNMTDEDYMEMVRKGIQSCHRGDVFQIVLSRRYQQSFIGDEIAVYRALRNINPSPYLFFFDYGDYKLMGSSPEAQVIIRNGKAVVHPIAGTFRRSGDDAVDAQAAEDLLKDPKENAEHVMLVDLARNDLSTVCKDVDVAHYRQVHYYSHVIHLVSEVVGTVPDGTNPFAVLAKTFPAGTLSGAPKYRAMQLIDAYEPTPRSYYGGAIGFVGLNGSCNHAIMIRTFLSKNNTLYSQAGAGVVAASKPESELKEVENKLNALKAAVKLAETLS